MKKKIAGAMILAMIMISTTFATNIHDDVNQNVLATFGHKFMQATNVNWAKSSNYYKASFTWNDQYMIAFFAPDGQLMGVTRNLPVTQIPINLQAELKNNLTGNWITELYEFASDQETAYYVTYENADQKVTLKSDGNYSWSVYKKIKKN